MVSPARFHTPNLMCRVKRHSINLSECIRGANNTEEGEQQQQLFNKQKKREEKKTEQSWVRHFA